MICLIDLKEMQHIILLPYYFTLQTCIGSKKSKYLLNK